MNCRDVSRKEIGELVGVSELGEADGFFVVDGEAVGRQNIVGTFEGLLDGLTEDGDSVGD